LKRKIKTIKWVRKENEHRKSLSSPIKSFASLMLGPSILMLPVQQNELPAVHVEWMDCWAKVLVERRNIRGVRRMEWCMMSKI